MYVNVRHCRVGIIVLFRVHLYQVIEISFGLRQVKRSSGMRFRMKSKSCEQLLQRNNLEIISGTRAKYWYN